MSALRTLRFIHCYLGRGESEVQEREVVIRAGTQEVEGSWFLPSAGRPSARWVVLHGITVPGRRHPSLLRFVRALAASGAGVLVPEVPAWRNLDVDPAPTVPTLTGALDRIDAEFGPAANGAGVIGFSFGATQAVLAAAHPTLRSRLGAVVGFGGYAELGRVARFMFTGEHEWRGKAYRAEPDPYARWILAGNHLTRVEGCGEMGRVAERVLRLATESGERGVLATHASVEELRRELDRGLTPEEREVWEVVAPPAGSSPPRARAEALADALTEAALGAHPGLDPRGRLDGLGSAVILAHGTGDRMIPFSETLRLHQLLPAARRRAPPTLTEVIAHSRREGRPGALEQLTFARLLARCLRAV